MPSRQLTDTLRETLAVFDGTGTPRTTMEVAERLDLGRRSTYDRLDRLVALGRLETKRVGASARVWWRPRPDDGTGASRDGDADPADPTADVADPEAEVSRSERHRDDLATAFEDAFDRITDGFYALDDDLRFTLVNERAEALLDLDRKAVVGEDIREVVPLTDRYEAALEEARERGEPVFVEDYYEPLGGWFENALYPSETGVSVYFRDVSRRKARQRALRESERRNRTLVDNFPNGVVALFDSDLRHTLAGGETLAAIDPSVEDIEGRTIREIFPPELAEQIEPHFRAVFDGETREFEVEAGDAIREFRVRPVRDADGEIVSGLGMSQDVTERKRRERELERYAGVVDAVGEPVYELDAEGRFTFVNEPFVDQSGYTEEELLGEHVSIGLDEETIAAVSTRIADHLEGDDGANVTVEYEIERRDGERIPTENRFSVLTDGDGRFRGTAGILWDVSERRERERELEESERRYRTLVENFKNGTVVLFDEDLKYLTVGGEFFTGLGFSADEAEGHTMADRLPAELFEELAPRYHAVFEGEAREFEVEFEGQIRYIRAFPVHDRDGHVFAGIAVSQDVTRHRERERELEHQREQLAALNQLNDVVRGITDAVIERSSREEIEEIVCGRLAESDSYRFAWIGEVDVDSQTLRPRTEAGVEGYLDDVTVSVDPEDERSRGPGGRAVSNRRPEVARDISNDASFEPWREAAEAYGFRSSVAIPIVHDDTLYGLLNVYAERPNAFTDAELEVVGQLGEIVGHAIAAVERKRALTSDEVVELGFTIDDAFGAFGVDVGSAGAITIEQATPIGEDTFLVYGAAAGGSIANLEALVDADDQIPWDSVTIVGTGEGATRFRATLVDPPVLSTVAARGGYVDEIRIEDGALSMRVHLAPTTDVRSVLDAVRDVYPSVDLMSHRQLTREQPSAVGFRGTVFEALTERQRSAVEAAYYGGYFATPRESTGEEVAAALGVSAPTFHHHLRRAQREILSTMLEQDPGGVDA